MHGWFDVDDAGFIAQQVSRPLHEVVRELVQNAFDAPEASRVSVVLTAERTGVRVVVEDDGIGFKNPGLAYTIFLSDKQDNPKVRGRKGRGLKEAIAAAQRAEVECLGTTVRFFTRAGKRGRREETNNRIRGSVVSVESERWTSRQIGSAVGMLRFFEPPVGIVYQLNGGLIANRSCRWEIPVRLQTVTYDNGEESLSTQDTTVRVLVPSGPNDEPCVMEMGIPVCPSDTPWHLDVQQRIPLPDHRNALPDGYRRKLLAAIMDHRTSPTGAGLIEVLSAKELDSDWVLESLRGVSQETRKRYLERKYGCPTGRIAIQTPKHHHLDAGLSEAGYTVVSSAHVPGVVRDILQEQNVRSTVRVAEDLGVRVEPSVQPTPDVPSPAPSQPTHPTRPSVPMDEKQFNGLIQGMLEQTNSVMRQAVEQDGRQYVPAEISDVYSFLDRCASMFIGIDSVVQHPRSVADVATVLGLAARKLGLTDES